MTASVFDELQSVVFVIYTDDGEGLDENESPVIGVRPTLRDAISPWPSSA